jgi:hypothetical protein
MIKGWLREDGQAIVELEVSCREGTAVASNSRIFF